MIIAPIYALDRLICIRSWRHRYRQLIMRNLCRSSAKFSSLHPKRHRDFFFLSMAAEMLAILFPSVLLSHFLSLHLSSLLLLLTRLVGSCSFFFAFSHCPTFLFVPFISFYKFTLFTRKKLYFTRQTFF